MNWFQQSHLGVYITISESHVLSQIDQVRVPECRAQGPAQYVGCCGKSLATVPKDSILLRDMKHFETVGLSVWLWEG